MAWGIFQKEWGYIVALTDVQVKAAKPREKDYKLTDGDGLFLLVAATGGKRWRFKYRFGGKEKLLALGTYSRPRGHCYGFISEFTKDFCVKPCVKICPDKNRVQCFQVILAFIG